LCDPKTNVNHRSPVMLNKKLLDFFMAKSQWSLFEALNSSQDKKGRGRGFGKCD